MNLLKKIGNAIAVLVVVFIVVRIACADLAPNMQIAISVAIVGVLAFLSAWMLVLVIWLAKKNRIFTEYPQNGYIKVIVIGKVIVEILTPPGYHYDFDTDTLSPSSEMPSHFWYKVRRLHWLGIFRSVQTYSPEWETYKSKQVNLAKPEKDEEHFQIEHHKEKNSDQLPIRILYGVVLFNVETSEITTEEGGRVTRSQTQEEIGHSSTFKVSGVLMFESSLLHPRKALSIPIPWEGAYEGVEARALEIFSKFCIERSYDEIKMEIKLDKQSSLHTLSIGDIAIEQSTGISFTGLTIVDISPGSKMIEELLMLKIKAKLEADAALITATGKKKSQLELNLAEKNYVETVMIPAIKGGGAGVIKVRNLPAGLKAIGSGAFVNVDGKGGPDND